MSQQRQPPRKAWRWVAFCLLATVAIAAYCLIPGLGFGTPTDAAAMGSKPLQPKFRTKNLTSEPAVETLVGTHEAVEQRQPMEGSANPQQSEAREPAEIPDHGLTPEEAVWEEFYRDATYYELQGELKAIRQAIDETTAPEYEKRFKDGRYDVLYYGTGEQTSRPLSEYHNNNELASFQVSWDGEVRKVLLTEEEFPAEYTLWRQANWVFKEMVKRPKAFRGQEQEED